MWQMKTVVVPVVVGALGTVKKGTVENIKKVSERATVTEIQKICMLGSTRRDNNNNTLSEVPRKLGTRSRGNGLREGSQKVKDLSLPHKIRFRIQSYLAPINYKNAGLFSSILREKGGKLLCVPSGDRGNWEKNRDESLYANKSCDEHVFYFRR